MKDLRINKLKRKEKIDIFVNGKSIIAYKGETVLAALLAAGFKAVNKNPVSHEFRGALCGMGVCFECCVTIDKVLNVRSCMTEVKENMRVEIDE